MNLSTSIPEPPSAIIAPMSDGHPARGEPGVLESALQVVSRLAVVWSFGLALLLIVAHRA